MAAKRAVSAVGLLVCPGRSEKSGHARLTQQQTRDHNQIAIVPSGNQAPKSNAKNVPITTCCFYENRERFIGATIPDAGEDLAK